MKIASVQPIFNNVSIQKRNNQANNSCLQSNVSFSARTFTPQQLAECNKIIERAENMSSGILAGSIFSSFFTAGTSLACIPIKNLLIKMHMVNALTEKLKITPEIASKIDTDVELFFFNARKVGQKFIQKASEID